MILNILKFIFWLVLLNYSLRFLRIDFLNTGVFIVDDSWLEDSLFNPPNNLHSPSTDVIVWAVTKLGKSSFLLVKHAFYKDYFD